MRSFLFGVAALVTCSAPVAAADMPARPVPVVSAAPLYDWGGFYGGKNAGWALGPAHWQYDVIPPASISHQMGGGFGGFQAGYNFQDRIIRARDRRRLRVCQHQRGPASVPIRPSPVIPRRAILPTLRAVSATPGTGCCFTQRAGEPGRSTGISRSPPSTPSAEPRRAPGGSAASALNMPTPPAGR